MSSMKVAGSAKSTEVPRVNRPTGPRRVVCLAETIERQQRLSPERRGAIRFRAQDVWWLRGARLRYGSSLRILNIASRGILVETHRDLPHGATVPIELIGPRTSLTVLAKVVRCRRVTAGEIAWYHTACRFLRPVDLRGLVPRFREPVRTTNSLDVALMDELERLACIRPQRIIARYHDSRVFSGYTRDFHPGHASLRLSTDPSFDKSFLVAMSELKTLVFVRQSPESHIVSVELDERVVVRSHVRNVDSERIEVTRSDGRGVTVYFDDPDDAAQRWIHWTVGSIPRTDSPASSEDVQAPPLAEGTRVNSIGRSAVDQNGVIARRARASEGFTVIELLLVMTLLVTLAAIAWPRLTQARLSANEAATIAAVRTVIEAQATFAASCGAGGYASSLGDLGAPIDGEPGFIPQDLMEGTKSGYLFTLSPRADANVIGGLSPSCGAASVETVDAYHLTAVPVSTGSTGHRSFATDHRGTIYQSSTGEPIANPIPTEVEPVG